MSQTDRAPLWIYRALLAACAQHAPGLASGSSRMDSSWLNEATCGCSGGWREQTTFQRFHALPRTGWDTVLVHHETAKPACRSRAGPQSSFTLSQFQRRPTLKRERPGYERGLCPGRRPRVVSSSLITSRLRSESSSQSMSKYGKVRRIQPGPADPVLGAAHAVQRAQPYSVYVNPNPDRT